MLHAWRIFVVRTALLSSRNSTTPKIRPDNNLCMLSSNICQQHLHSIRALTRSVPAQTSTAMTVDRTTHAEGIRLQPLSGTPLATGNTCCHLSRLDYGQKYYDAEQLTEASWLRPHIRVGNCSHGSKTELSAEATGRQVCLEGGRACQSTLPVASGLGIISAQAACAGA